MNRGVITISKSGTVSMPTDTVWMTMQEIADMYNVFGCYVRKAVKAVFKDGILKEQGVRRHVRKNDRISYDVYSLELVIAVAFRIDSIESRAFREFIMQSVIGSIAKMMGHADITSTQVYAQVTEQKISNDMDKLIAKRERNKNPMA